MTELKNIKDVKINKNLPVPERKADYIRQIGNPYHYKDGDYEVFISFSGTKSLSSKIKDLVASFEQTFL